MKKIANRFFYKIDNQGRPIPGTLARFVNKPKQGRWREVPADACCPGSIIGCNFFSVTKDINDLNGLFISNLQILSNGVEVEHLLNSDVSLNGKVTYSGLFSLSVGEEITVNIINDPSNLCISYQGLLLIKIYSSDGTFDTINGVVYDAVGSLTATFNVLPNKTYKIEAQVGCGN